MKQTRDQATKRPWHLGERGIHIYGQPDQIADDAVEQRVAVCDPDGLYHKGMSEAQIKEEAKANAALIVRCVNAHDAMKEALATAIMCMERDGNASACASLNTMGRAALALAKGE